MPSTDRLMAELVRPAILALLPVLALSGCAPMVSSKEELQSVAPNEGLVAGSFVINVEKGPENESGWAFLQGRKAGDSEYGVSVNERPSGAIDPAAIFKTTYRFEVKPEQEFTFLKKLPAGMYHVSRVEQLGFSNLYVSLSKTFTVTAGRTTYIGRLTMVLPDRIRAYSSVRTKVTDAQDETVGALKKEYGDALLSNVAKDLMR